MRGRKPSANAIRRSDDHADISAATVIGQAGGEMAMPAEVAASPSMSALWSSIVGTGVAYDPRDVPLLEQLVFDLEMARQARAHVYGEDGALRLMVACGEPDPDTGEPLQVRPNPYVKVMHDSVQQALRLADQLGCTPLARARLGLTQAAGKAVTLSIAEQIDRAVSRR